MYVIIWVYLVSFFREYFVCCAGVFCLTQLGMTYTTGQVLLPGFPSNANSPHRDLNRDCEVQRSVGYVNLAIAIGSCQDLRVNRIDIYPAPKEHRGIDIQHGVRQSEKRQGADRQMMGALPPFVAVRVTTCPLIAVLSDMVDHRYQTNHCSVV